MTPTHKKFTFDTVFDDLGGIASEPVRMKKTFTPEEVERERAKAFAEGERSVVARAEQLAAAALADISAQVRAAMPALAAVAHEHRAATAVLSLACGKVIAGAALEKFPDAPVEAALQALAREVEAEPRLLIRANANLVERMQIALNKTADACGFAGQILVKGDPTMAPAAFVLDWSDGRAAFDPIDAASRVELALNNALEAEGLHAEPLIPPTPAPGA